MARALAVVLALLVAPGAVADGAGSGKRGVSTNRSGARFLPLPEGGTSFQFAIFGDRTGGPKEGLKVLEQAVQDTNLLAPDLVMTVGDLVQGYGDAEDWVEQMTRYRKIMSRLRMRWYPVAGNHDVYWRGRDPKRRPKREHEPLYEKHFGPLWYDFAHKGCGFVVLFSDEGDPKTGEKGFRKKARMQMSARQLEWLAGALKRHRARRHVFVFVHHPRWIAARYKESNWAAVHRLLRGAGNVRAVFGGHIHRMRYDRTDGIEYFTLATTGGNTAGPLHVAGYAHHLNLVTVRDGRVDVAAVPVGSVIDPRRFSAARLAEIDAVRGIGPRLVGGPVRLAADGAVRAVQKLEVRNPSKTLPVEVVVTPEARSRRWWFSPRSVRQRLTPGQAVTLSFEVTRRGPVDDGFAWPGVTVQVVLPGDPERFAVAAGRGPIALPERWWPLRVTTPSPGAEMRLRAAPRELAMDGKDGSGLSVEDRELALPDGPLTVEAWINGRNFGGGVRSICAKTEGSEFGLFVFDSKPTFLLHLDGKYVRVEGSAEALDLHEWHHVAGVFDGKQARLYVDGRLVGSAAAAGTRTRNRLPLWIGAEPDRRGRPVRAWLGRIDEVRVSRVARYAGARFAPADWHAVDVATMLLMRCDLQRGPFVFDASPRRLLGYRRGRAKLMPATRRGRVH